MVVESRRKTLFDCSIQDSEELPKVTKKIKEIFVDLKTELFEANAKESGLKCRRKLNNDFSVIKRNIGRGKYSSKGSFNQLEADLERVRDEFFAAARMEEFGPQVSEVFQNFNNEVVSQLFLF